MIHHQYNPSFEFVERPESFDKYTDRSLLQYCLGATMYMPGTKDFYSIIMTKKYPGLTSMAICFEDACKEENVPAAELNSIRILDKLNESIENGELSEKDLPLIVFRVRNTSQFIHFSSMLKKEHIHLIAAFNFPKFNSKNGEEYCRILQDLNVKFGEIIYGMPILEDRTVAFKETRVQELYQIKEILDRYRELILNVRVGGTDFSSCFGMRRGINYTVYDIMPVRDCLSDILNIFLRDNAYTVSGAVWEYFRAAKQMRWSNLPEYDFTTTLIKRETIVNDAVDGLLRELVLDKANGFIGKTIIHPSHLNFVNGMFAVTKEEFDDANQILCTSGGVIKSINSNKMNEIGPHKNWAERIIMRSKAYGVIKNEQDYLKLFSV